MLKQFIKSNIAVLFISLLILIIWVYDNIYKKDNDVSYNETITSLSESTKKLSNIITTKEDFEKIRKDLEKINLNLSDKIKKSGEKLDEIGIIRSELEQTRKLINSSDKIYNKEGKEYHHYEYKVITIKNKNGKNVKVAWVMYYPNREPEKRWKFGTFELNSIVSIVETTNRDGSINRYADQKLLSDGLELPIKMNEFKWEKISIKDNKMFWFNPRIALSGTLSNQSSFGLNLSLMSYGKTEIDMLYRFASLGVNIDGDNSISTTFIPFDWNVGKSLPIINNLFIGPSIRNFNLTNFESYGINFSVPF